MTWRDGPRLPDMVALAVQTHRDEDAPRRALRQRDRALAVRHGLDRAELPAARRVLGWARNVEDGTLRSRIAGGWSVLVIIGAALSALLGVAAALALYRYDGTRPVNVLAVLIVFVALPLVTAVVSLIGMVGWWPGSGALRALSPAGLLWSALRRAPGAVGQTAEQLRGGMRRSGRLMGGATRWTAWAYSQAMGLLFVVAGLLTFVVLLATTDLAFGWASTLEWDPKRLQTWLAALLWFYPAAAPDLAMVDHTIVDRAESFPAAYAIHEDDFKRWWRPLLWLIVGYALVPRMVLAAVAAWCSRRATRRAFERFPNVDEIDRRMAMPVVEVHPETASAAQTTPRTKDASAEQGEINADGDLPDHGPVVRWSSAPLPSAIDGADVLQAGGDHALAQDEAAVHRAAETDGPVRVFVKAWEPPLGEFVDFLGALRERIGDGRMVHVAAITRDARDHDAAAVWRRKLAALGDPWLRVVSVAVSSTSSASTEQGGDA